VRVTFCPLVIWGARSDTVPGFTTGGVHPPTTWVVFFNVFGSLTTCSVTTGGVTFSIFGAAGVAVAFGLLAGVGVAVSASAVFFGSAVISDSGELSRDGSGASGSGNGDCAGCDSTTPAATVGTVSCCALTSFCALSSILTSCTLTSCMLTSCGVFAFTPTSEIVMPSTGTAISAPTTTRMILGCFARTSEFMHSLTQDHVFWLHGRLDEHVDPPGDARFLLANRFRANIFLSNFFW